MSMAITIVTALGVLAGITFMACYARIARGRWYKYHVGWHLMTNTTALTVLLAMLLARRFGAPVTFEVWGLMIAAIVATLWHRVWILIQVSNTTPEELRTAEADLGHPIKETP